MATGWCPLPPQLKGGCPKFVCESDARLRRKLSRHPTKRKRVGSVAGSRCWSVAMAVKMATLGRVQVVRHLWTGGLSVINCFLATCSLIDVIILLFEAKQLLTNVLQGARALKMIKIKLWITWFYNLARWKKRWTAIKRHRVRYNASSEWPTRILRMGKCW